jgi:hypothetical protein
VITPCAGPPISQNVSGEFWIDSGYANFFLESSKPEDAVPLDYIASSFRPTGRTLHGALCL